MTISSDLILKFNCLEQSVPKRKTLEYGMLSLQERGWLEENLKLKDFAGNFMSKFYKWIEFVKSFGISKQILHIT